MMTTKSDFAKLEPKELIYSIMKKMCVNVTIGITYLNRFKTSR